MKPCASTLRIKHPKLETKLKTIPSMRLLNANRKGRGEDFEEEEEETKECLIEKFTGPRTGIAMSSDVSVIK